MAFFCAHFNRAGVQHGFTYIGLLFALVLGGATLAALGVSVRMQTQRELEAELAFRGEQYALALTSYANATVEGQPTRPSNLQELLIDRRGPGLPRHHLRKLWVDPITHQAFALVLLDGRIKGVHSTSTAQIWSRQRLAAQYDEWVFGPPE